MESVTVEVTTIIMNTVQTVALAYLAGRKLSDSRG